MEVKHKTETSTKEIFETKTHVFKINTDTLDRLKELASDKLEKKLKRKIVRNLRPISDNCNGRDWEESYQSILNNILEQSL